MASTRSGPLCYDRLYVARLVINMGCVGGIERGTSRLGRECFVDVCDIHDSSRIAYNIQIRRNIKLSQNVTRSYISEGSM